MAVVQMAVRRRLGMSKWWPCVMQFRTTAILQILQDEGERELLAEIGDAALVYDISSVALLTVKEVIEHGAP